MTTISTVNSNALLILQQTNSLNATEQANSASNDLAAIANGVADKMSVTRQPGQAESKISEAMYSVNNVNINKLKLDLIDRAATELGFDQNNYDSRGEFVSAMRRELVKMATSDAGTERITTIEKKLGLDKLGVSLMDVVRSARDPEAEDKVSAALREQEGQPKEEDAQPDASEPLPLQIDDIGRYGASQR